MEGSAIGEARSEVPSLWPGSSRPNSVRGRGRALKVVEFIRGLYLGGTETQFIEILRGLHARHRLLVGVYDEGGPLQWTPLEMGIHPRVFAPPVRFIHPGTLWQVIKLARWFRDEGVDLVHVHDFAPTLTVVPAAELAGTKVVVSRLDLAHYHDRAQRALLAGLTRLADHVVANAEAISAMLVKDERIDPARVTVVRNGIDLARFDRARRQGLTAPLPEVGEEPVVIHVANMNHPVKRQEDLLQAVSLLQSKDRAVRLFLVGDGPRRPMLERLASSLGVSRSVHFLGHRQDVPAIYARGAVGVLCSSAEGLSNAVIEGMAAGLPMVVTDAGGSPELVSPGRGLVVPIAAPQALASAIDRILAQPELAAQLGERARRYVESELTVEAMVDRLDGVYQRVANPTTRV